MVSMGFGYIEMKGLAIPPSALNIQLILALQANSSRNIIITERWIKKGAFSSISKVLMN